MKTLQLPRLVLLPTLLLACGAGSGVAATPAASVVAASDPLARASIDVLSREACPRLLVRTFPLQETKQGQASSLVSGKLWVRRCETRVTAQGTLNVDVDVLGWQWADESSWGFGVNEYVYFTAAIRAELSSSIEETASSSSSSSASASSPPPPSVHVRAEGDPKVTVREIGRVSARATSLASGLFGVASGILGQGPNTLATSAFRSRVRSLIEDRMKSGIEIALADTPAPGQRTTGTSATTVASTTAILFEETERLHPGGALLSGSYPAGIETELRWNAKGVAAGSAALARPVCVEEAVELVDSVIATTKAPVASASKSGSTATTPQNLIKLEASGSARLPAMPCRWLLVVGASGAEPQEEVVVDLSLRAAAPPRADATNTPPAVKKRWVRVTLLSFDLRGSKGANDVQLISFKVGPHLVGQPLTTSQSPAVWLVADPVEIGIDGEPPTSIDIAITALKPKSRSFLSATTAYDESPLGHAHVTPSRDDDGGAFEEKDIAIERDGQNVGTLRVSLESANVASAR